MQYNGVTSYLHQPGQELLVLDGAAGIISPPELPGSLLWIDVDTDDADVMGHIASAYGLHELTVEDCIAPDHYPKLDDYGTYLFMVFRGLLPQTLPGLQKSSETEEASGSEPEALTATLCMYLADNFIITVRSQEIAWLDALGRQVKQYPDRTLALGSESFAHRIIDVLIDRFLRGLGNFEDIIDQLEESALNSPEEFELAKILEVKRQLVTLKQIMRDQRAVISRLAHEAALISEESRRRYFRDIEDHAGSILKSLDKLADELVGLRDTYFAQTNARLGDAMRIMTVITTIAAPLNIVVGIFGMNFDVLPLAHNPHGFWLMLVFMLLCSIIMVMYFKAKKWL